MKRTKVAIAGMAMMLSAASFGAPNSASQTPGGQPVNNQVRGELYGNNQPTNQPLYGPQWEPLPSESLLATQRSGALPSELRFMQEQVGPLAPFGAASYIPLQSALQRAAHATPPTLWGPAWGTPQPIPDTGPAAPIPGPSVRKGVVPGQTTPTTDLPPPAEYVNPQEIQTGYRLSADPRQFNSEGTTTVRILRRTRPAATGPATQPSKAEQLLKSK